jgi:hypothetical protein
MGVDHKGTKAQIKQRKGVSNSELEILFCAFAVDA